MKSLQRTTTKSPANREGLQGEFAQMVDYDGRTPVFDSISIRFSWVMILQDRMPFWWVECGNFPSRIQA
jgi:hypothetical protein